MKNNLTPNQLNQIIAEVEQLKQQREQELNSEQVKEILQELNLPPELLDEALIQLQRRQALAVEKKRQRWIATGAIISIIAAIALTTIISQQQQQALEKVSTVQSQISLNQDGTNNVTTISRQVSPLIFYRVTLQDAPIGKKISLNCNWIDPNNQIVHQNSWETKTIDRATWNTYCRYQFNSSATPGLWKVQMLLGDRILSTTSFTVK
ncbi:MAG TPA: hypothetical protein V6D15_08610 [Oculatellaceae cyanobacterium]|jgi:type II secretory pathway pseudopilin PulG